MSLDVRACRAQFPALQRQHDGGSGPAVYLDGPAGTQTPQVVIDAIVDYLTRCNANHGGVFATSRESDQLLQETHHAVAALLGANDADEVSFGANMTSLTFHISRSIARTWQPGDEVIVTRLDHDANVSPWALAARDAGATVKMVDLRDDCTLDFDDFRRKLSDRTKFVAVGAASNSTGGVNPVREFCDAAHEVGALAFVDAVHYAPHALIDVAAFDCDLLACSAYKFFGPHIGILWGRRHLMESLEPYKVRPAADGIPDRWMTGTQNHECLAGVKAAVEYLASLGEGQGSLRQRLQSAYQQIQAYERQLCQQLLEGLEKLPEVRVWGSADPRQLEHRVATVSITHASLPAGEVAARLAEQGIFVWSGNYYALNFTEALGLEPDGMVRLGLVHYNTEEEVERLLTALAEL